MQKYTGGNFVSQFQLLFGVAVQPCQVKRAVLGKNQGQSADEQSETQTNVSGVVVLKSVVDRLHDIHVQHASLQSANAHYFTARMKRDDAAGCAYRTADT